jgi:hypothetical protein
MKSVAQFIVVLAVLASVNVFAEQADVPEGTTVYFNKGEEVGMRIDNVDFVYPTVSKKPEIKVFAGRWKLDFVTVENNGKTVNERWFPLYFELVQEGIDIKGTIVLQDDAAQKQNCTRPNLEETRGEVKAVAKSDSLAASGEIKMCWDKKFWPEFVIDLETKTGTATHITEGGVVHKYTFTVERLN